MIRKVMAVCLLLALFVLAGSAAALADGSMLEIRDLEGLKAFRDRVNQGETFAGWMVRLTADINLDAPSGGVRAGGAIAYLYNQHGPNNISGTGVESTLDNVNIKNVTISTTSGNADAGALIGGMIGDVRDGNTAVVFRNANTVNATVIGKTASADMDPSEASYKPEASYQLKGRQSIVDLHAAANGDVVVGKNGDVKIYGGTYDNDVSGLVAKGYACVDNGDGTFTVVKLSIAAGLPQTGDSANLVLWLALALSSTAFLAARRMRRAN